MAKVILDSGDTFVAASTVTILGSTGSETVKIQDGVTATVDTSVERIEFTGASSAYTFKSTPTGVQVVSGSTVVANVANGNKLSFSDGSVTVAVGFAAGALTYTVGGATVTGTAGPLTGATVDTAAAEKSTIVAGTGAVTGQAFTLTASSTPDTMVLTAGSDTVTGATGTVADTDLIMDASSADNDIANLVITSNYTPSVMTNVEHINLDWDAYTTATYDLTSVSGAQDITMTTSKVGFLGDASVSAAKGNYIKNGSGMVGTLTVTGATTGVKVDAGSAASMSVTGTGTATLTAGASTTTASSLGFTTSTITGGAATTGITVKDAGAGSTTSIVAVSDLTLTKSATFAGKINADIANGKTLTLAQELENTLTVTGSGATATVAAGTGSLDAKTVVNSKTAGTLTVSSSDVDAADVSAVSATLIKLSGTVNGAITVADGQNLQFSNTTGTTKIDLTGKSGASTETVSAVLNGAVQTAVLTTTLKQANLTAAAAATSGTDLTISTLTTNGSKVVLSGTNDVAVTSFKGLAAADDGTVDAAGTLDASALVGSLTVTMTRADDTVAINLGTGNGTVTTADSAKGTITVVGQGGNDTVTTKVTTGSTTAVLGAGDNTVTAAEVTEGTIVVTAGAGIDTVTAGAALTTGTLNLNLGDGANVVTLSNGEGDGHMTVVTGAGDDTITLKTLTDGDIISINAGTGADVLVINGGAHAGIDLSDSTTTLSGIETILLDGTVEGNMAVFDSRVLSGATYTMKGDAHHADNSFTVKGVATTTAINLSGLVIDATLTNAIPKIIVNASAGTDAQTITGTGVADAITGGAGNDTITAGNGADTITGGAGNDTINLTETLVNSAVDNVIFAAIATNGSDTINGFKIGKDTLTLFGDTETTIDTDAGAAEVDFFGTSLTSGAAAWVAGAGVGGLTTATADVVVISTTLSTYGDLSTSTTGTELLKALSSTSTAATQITSGNGDDFYIVAYQNGNAYVYQATNDANTAVLASEITLIGTVTGVTAGTLTAAEFLVGAIA